MDFISLLTTTIVFTMCIIFGRCGILVFTSILFGKESEETTRWANDESSKDLTIPIASDITFKKIGYGRIPVLSKVIGFPSSVTVACVRRGDNRINISYATHIDESLTSPLISGETLHLVMDKLFREENNGISASGRDGIDSLGFHCNNYMRRDNELDKCGLFGLERQLPD